MSSAYDLDQAMHAAELAALAMAARAVFARASGAESDVVSMAFSVTLESPGLAVIECEYRDRSGHAIGGFGL